MSGVGESCRYRGTTSQHTDVTVNKPNSSVDQMEELLKRLLGVLTPAVPVPAKVPETSPMDQFVQLLLSETGKRKPAPPVPVEPAGL